jgi:hypothetical protein
LIGSNYSFNYNDDNVATSATDQTAAAPAQTGSNLAQNTTAANSPGSVYWLLLLTGLYFIYYYWYNRSWKESINKDAVLSFLHQACSVAILAAVGINIINVLLTKLAALKIPVLSKVAGTFLPLFHL